MMRNKM